MAIKTRTGADGPHVATALVVFQCLIIVVMTAVAKYHPYADAKDNRNSALSHQGGFQLGLDERELYKFYIMFQDVHVMIFAGFGFLMSFLKRYGYSSTGFTLLLGALMVQWGILCHGFFRLDPLDHKIPISIESLLSADVATAAILISMGAVLGKTTPLQLLIMGFIEMIVFTANEYLGIEVFKLTCGLTPWSWLPAIPVRGRTGTRQDVFSLQAVDAGGSMYVHVFGAYFGLAVSLTLGHGKVIAKSEGEDSNEGSSYTSDIFAMIALEVTLDSRISKGEMVWTCNEDGKGNHLKDSDGELKYVEIRTKERKEYMGGADNSEYVNERRSTVEGDGGILLDLPGHTLDIVHGNDDDYDECVHIQNSTLAGGVAVGTVCDLMIHPFGAVLIGMLAGVVSVLGYRFLQPYLLSLIHLHDTCGVNNLHGIPGVMSGVMGAVVAGLATEKDYNYSLYQQFPARMPPANSSDYWEYAAHLGGDVHPGVGRSASGQAGYQLLALSVTFLVAWVSGALTGAVMRSSTVQGGVTLQLFSDGPFWHLGEDERVLTLAPIFRVSESRATRTSGGEDIFSTRVHSPASTSASVDQSRRHVLNAALALVSASHGDMFSTRIHSPASTSASVDQSRRHVLNADTLSCQH
uniref:Ammonium transporter AmtB-like domain-containing protein n=1 Tax=Timema cristinae TaxID=61476 RepID=A0A7R9D025_TIMCR|nr:unnamed protein product [Timema cristinae]